jgi:hypothetical protein
MPIIINPDNISEFDNMVNNQNFLLRYHSPNCIHCLSMEKEWKSLDDEKMLKEKNIAIVDIDVGIAYLINHPSAKSAEINGVPSIYFIKQNQIFEYSGERTARKIADFAMIKLDKEKDHSFNEYISGLDNTEVINPLTDINRKKIKSTSSKRQTSRNTKKKRKRKRKKKKKYTSKQSKRNVISSRK